MVGTLGDYLTDATVPIEVRHAIPRALGEIHAQESVNALFRARDRNDVKLSYRVLKASNRLRASGLPQVNWVVTKSTGRDTFGQRQPWLHSRHGTSAREGNAERLLRISLDERAEQALNRVFRRLALLYPPQNILAAYRGVTSGEPRARGNAIEYLENALAADHRALVLPLVDDGGDEARIRVAEQRYGIRFASYERSLRDIAESDDAWLRACALFVVGARKEKSMLPLVEANLHTLNALVRETASWARLAIVTG